MAIHSKCLVLLLICPKRSIPMEIYLVGINAVKFGSWVSNNIPHFGHNYLSMPDSDESLFANIF